MDTYSFLNVSGQNYFLTEIKRKIDCDENKVYTFTADDIGKCELLAMLINRGQFIQVQPDEVPVQNTEPNVQLKTSKENDPLGSLPIPNPFPETYPARNVLIDDDVHRPSVIIDDSESRIQSIYLDNNEVKKNS